MGELSPLRCDHANEVPLVCKCAFPCYCHEAGNTCGAAANTNVVVSKSTPKMAVHFSSKNEEWYTPKWILDRLPPISYDPCNAWGNPTNAKLSSVKETNGLDADWANISRLGHESGLVYCNPPYGRVIVDWLRKRREALHTVYLLPARTDTKWFHEETGGMEICFLRGRITFVGAPAPAPFPSLLLYRGPERYFLQRRFGDKGLCFEN